MQLALQDISQLTDIRVTANGRIPARSGCLTTAEPIGRPTEPARIPAAIPDTPPPGDRADFGRFYAQALEEARRS